MASNYTVRFAVLEGEDRLPRRRLAGITPIIRARIRDVGASVDVYPTTRNGRPILRLDASSAHDLRPAWRAIATALDVLGLTRGATDYGAAAARALRLGAT